MSKKYKIIALFIAFFIAFCYDFLFPGPDLGINFSIYVFLILIACILLKFSIDKKIANLWSFLFCIPILWYAGSVAVYENNFVHVASPMVSIFLLILFLFWSGVFEKPLRGVKRILPLSFFAFMGRFFSKIIYPFKNLFNFNAKTSSKILIGLIISLPLILIFGGLFASADLIFREWIKNLFDFQINVHNAWRFVRTIILFLFFCGVLSAYGLQKRFLKPLSEKEQKAKKKKRDHLIANVTLSLLNIFFLIFIFLQIMFLFGDHEVIEKYDISYADYVHQGFYQMCVIAVFVLIISYMMIRINKSVKFDFMKVLNGVFIIQALIIAASALKRMFLYQEAYGLTVLRFLVWHFIIYIGLILFALLLVILFKKHYRLFVKLALLISIVYLMFMTGVNIQSRVAKENIDRYLSGQDKEIDMEYLFKLSTDVSAQMNRLKNHDSQYVRDYYQRWLDTSRARASQGKWQSITLSEIKFWQIYGHKKLK